MEHPRRVLLSTHLIDEVSRSLEHILVIDQGKLILDEEAEALRGRAFAVVGPAAKVDTYIAGKELLDLEPFGGLVSTTVMGSWPALWPHGGSTSSLALPFCSSASFCWRVPIGTGGALSTAGSPSRARQCSVCGWCRRLRSLPLCAMRCCAKQLCDG